MNVRMRVVLALGEVAANGLPPARSRHSTLPMLAHVFLHLPLEGVAIIIPVFQVRKQKSEVPCPRSHSIQTHVCLTPESVLLAAKLVFIGRP